MPYGSTPFFSRSAGIGLATLLALGLAAAHPAQAQINGFSSGFTLNHGGDATHTGDSGDGGNPASIAANVLTITDNSNSNGNSEANSAIYGTPQSITNWKAVFTYTNVNGGTGGGNGFTFFLENAPQGTGALGGRGDGMGYGSDDSHSRNPNYIADSAAIAFNAYNGDGRPTGTEFLTAGATGTTVGTAFTGTSAVSLQSADPILVSLSYDGTTLSETLTDATANTTYSTTYATNLASVLGGNTAFVGFGGGTGGANLTQTISGFSFTPAPEPSQAAALGLGAFGLTGLILIRRRRLAR